MFSPRLRFVPNGGLKVVEAGVGRAEAVVVNFSHEHQPAEKCHDMIQLPDSGKES